MIRIAVRVCAWCALAGPVASLSAQQPMVAAASASGVIVFQPVRADLEVIGWAADSVRLTIAGEAGIRVEMDAASGGVRFHERRSAQQAAARPRYTLFVPAGAVVRVALQAGSISVRNLTGSVRAGIVDGEVRADSVSGDVELSSVTGPVGVSRSSGHLAARSVAGDVSIRQVTGSVRARTTSGDLTISLSGVRALEAESYSGRIVFHGLLGGAPSSFATHSGDIHLRLPLTQNATMLVTSVEGRTIVECGSRNVQPARGEPVVLGSGGQSVDVITFTGNVRITCPD